MNDSLLDLLVDGQAHLQMGNCDDVKEKAAQIKALATVPLVQGALTATVFSGGKKHPSEEYAYKSVSGCAQPQE